MPLPSSITPELLAELTGRVVSEGPDGLWACALNEVYTGDLITALPQSSPADVERAFVLARHAQAEWAAWPVRRRMAVFRRFHRLLIERNETIVDLIQAETGKARRMAFEETCDIPMVISHYLKRAPRLLRPTTRGGAVPLVSTSTELRQPKGVVGVIAPWNFPFAIGLCDAVPALMAGNGIVLKPDNRTALSPLYGIGLLYEAGLPEGLFQVVCGEGPDVGPTLIDQADYVMFTGSQATGRQVAARASGNLTEVCLELGGKNPMIVLDDANLDEVIPATLAGVFANTGQLCLHIERIYLPDSLYDTFRTRFVAEVESLNLAAGYDFEAEVGSLVSTEHLARVSAHVEDARERGATVLTGGRPRPDLGPAFYEPTVLEGVDSTMSAAESETFGPVVSLYLYRSVDEAVALANHSAYGLNASVWGTDLKAARLVAARLEAGNINVNDAVALAYGSKGTPSGGLKGSGLGVRNGDAGLLKYTDVKNLAVLKRQVLAAPRDKPYADHVKRTLTSLALMRRTRLR